MKILKSVVLTLLATVVAISQTQVTGDLAAKVNTFINNMPSGTSTNQYQVPSSTHLNQWGNTITKIIQGQYSAANDTAALIGYQLLEYTDNTTSPNRLYYVLEKTTASTNHWGMFIYNPNSSRPKLFIQSPHPKNDLNTGQQGYYIFKNVGARAYYVSGTHRCNSSLYSSCSGTTTVCSEEAESYRKSDQAHNVDGTLQRSTEILRSSISNLIAIQVHGFSWSSGDPNAIISNGTEYYPTGTDHLVNFKNNLFKIDTTLDIKVVHVDNWTELRARENTQGRLINGVSSPCGTYASSSTGRFLHLEQAYAKLRDTQANWAKLASAVAMTFPIMPAASGDWSSPTTWGDGQVPDSTTNVIVATGQTITVSDNSAKCLSISFEDLTSKLAMAAGGVLSVYGDFTPNSTAHIPFSSWTDGAKLQFSGSAATQTIGNIRNNNNETNMAFFKSIAVDKPAGKVTVSGSSDSKLNISNSLEIINGTFELPTDFDINGRAFNGTTDAYPTITVSTGGTFNMVGGASQIMSRPSLGKIGKLTVFGSAYIRTTSTNKANLGDVDIEAGGTLYASSFSNLNPALFNPGIVTIKDGGEFQVITGTNFWEPTSSILLNTGGLYRINTDSIHNAFPPTFTNNGKVRYAGTNQAIKDINYHRLEISFSGSKVWTLSVNRIISDSLEINNSATLQIAGTNSPTVNGTLRLTSGTLNNSTQNIALANGATISRATGTISTTPIFGTSLNVRYTSTTTSITTGPELPISSSALNNLTITSTGQIVTLGTNATVNGTLALTNGLLNLGSNNLSLGISATVSGTPSASNMVVATGSGELRKQFSSTASFTFPVGDNTETAEYSPVTLNFVSGTFSSAYAGVKLMNTKHPLNTSTNDFLNRYWTVVSSGISNYSCNANFVYADGDIVGTESNLILGQLTNQWNVVGTCNPTTNTFSVVGLNSFSDFTGGEVAALPVQLASFVGSFVGNGKAKLEWQTISEINNYGFNVQRYNSITKSYETIGFVAGKGIPNNYSYIDENVSGSLEYRLEQIDNNGLKSYFGPIMLSPNNVKGEVVPAVFKLNQNYPNPFNPSTKISFSLANAGYTTLKVYNVIGKEVAMLFSGNAEASRMYNVDFDGSQLPSGLYFYKLQSGNSVEVRKLTLVK
jgi:hypothetical protein